MSSSLYLTAATRRSSSDEYLSFLDYPHAHDPTSISDIAALSTDLLRQLPTEAQDSLWLLQESASVVHSSYARLQDLLEEKFERLSYQPQDGWCKCTLVASTLWEMANTHRLRACFHKLCEPAYRRARLPSARRLFRLEAQTLHDSARPIPRSHVQISKQVHNSSRLVHQASRLSH